MLSVHSLHAGYIRKAPSPLIQGRVLSINDESIMGTEMFNFLFLENWKHFNK